LSGSLVSLLGHSARTTAAPPPGSIAPLSSGPRSRT
jgi:hypothetical protein